MGAFTTMTSKGQLTIPKDVREELSLKPGTKFFVTVRNGQVVALPKNRHIADLAAQCYKIVMRDGNVIDQDLSFSHIV